VRAMSRADRAWELAATRALWCPGSSARLAAYRPEGPGRRELVPFGCSSMSTPFQGSPPASPERLPAQPNRSCGRLAPPHSSNSFGVKCAPPMTDNELVKVYVDLPGHWHSGGESLWAKPLGGDLYEILSVPFAAYGLNFGDVVRACDTGAELKPEIQCVVTPSGRRTLRVFFHSLSADEQSPLLDEIRGWGADIERASKSFVAVDIPTDADYDLLFDHLESLERRGVLEFETCEARVEGSFTSLPEKAP